MPRSPLLSSTRLIALLSLTACTLASPAAWAGRTESRVWAGLGVNSARPGTAQHQLGAGSQFGFTLTLTEFLSLSTGLDAAFHFAQDTDTEAPLPSLVVSDVFVGLQYNLDVFTYIPYVGLGLVGYINGPPTPQGEAGPDLGVKLALGMMYRPGRHWSVGGSVDLHSSLTAIGDFALYTLLNLHVSYHWDW